MWRRAGGYCCRPGNPKEMTAIEYHGRVSSEAEQELAGHFVSEIVARPPGLQGDFWSGRSDLVLLQVRVIRIYLK